MGYFQQLQLSLETELHIVLESWWRCSQGVSWRMAIAAQKVMGIVYLNTVIALLYL
jgi:hypothetical protein